MSNQCSWGYLWVCVYVFVSVCSKAISVMPVAILASKTLYQMPLHVSNLNLIPFHFFTWSFYVDVCARECRSLPTYTFSHPISFSVFWKLFEKQWTKTSIFIRNTIGCNPNLNGWLSASGEQARKKSVWNRKYSILCSNITTIIASVNGNELWKLLFHSRLHIAKLARTQTHIRRSQVENVN